MLVVDVFLCPPPQRAVEVSVANRNGALGRGDTRRSYGFRTYQAMELALYHNLGRLPEPENTHRFC